jgi:RNA polymerase-interacting CarD/CdnL/TRCF family regulator
MTIETELAAADKLGWDMTALAESTVGVWYCCLSHRKLKRPDMDLTVAVEVHSQHTPEGAISKALNVAKELYHKQKPAELNSWQRFELERAVERLINTMEGVDEDDGDYI